MRGLFVVLGRAGLRISEALALAESDLDLARDAILVRCGNGRKRREVDMNPWGWDASRPRYSSASAFPVGALFCTIHGPRCGRPWSAPAAREQLRRIVAGAGVRHRFARTSCATHMP